MGILWIRLSSDLFIFREDVFICTVYIPPSDSKVLNAIDSNFWDEIERGIELHSTSGKVYVTGDMNGRTSNFSDILDFDKYLEDDSLFTTMSHVPIRVNKDHMLDSHGRKLLDLCKSSGFVIANGRLGDDYGVGEVTYYATQGISTIDYLLLHNTNLESVFKFQVLTPNEFSDHAALYFSFAQSNHVQKINRQTENITAGENRIYWDSVKEPDFQQLLVETADRSDSINDINRTINEKVEIFSR